MNFKKLLTMIGMLTVVVPTSMTVVACGSQTNNDVTKESAVQKILEKGIDGSTLGLLNTQQDALNLMQNANGVKGIAVLSFVKKEDATKGLELGNNTLNIKITVGKTEHTTSKALIKNVAVTDKELAMAIKRELEQGNDASNLSVKNTQQDALNLLLSQLVNNPKVSIVFVNKDDASKKLVGGNNTLNLKITVGTETQTTNSALITNVNPVNPDDKAAAEKVQKLVESGIDGSTLGLSNTKQDALNLMQKAKGIEGIANLSFVNSNDSQQNLHLGNNTLNIKITVGKVELTTSKALIKNVSVTDKELAMAIKRELEQGNDASNLSVKNTQQDALNLLLSQLINNPKVTLDFNDKKDASQHLVGGNNTLNLKITVGTETQTTKGALITNVNPVNPDDKTAAEKVQNVLETGINGSSLNDQQTYLDALNFMQKADGIKGIAALSFVNKDDGKNPLKLGNNLLNIQITVGTVNISTSKALITNIQQSDDEKTANAIKSLLETTGIDASKSNIYAGQTFQDALTFIQKDPAIINKATLKFTNDIDAKKILVAGNDNILNLTITVGKVNLVANAKFINVQNHDQDIINNISKINYSLTAKDGDSAQSIKSQINADFIKSSLPDNIKKFFEDSKFELTDVTVNKKSLSDQDLKTVGNIDASINYKYDGKVSTTKLTITVNAKYT